MSLQIVAAISNNWVLGSEGRIPWTCEMDRNRFKSIIEGHDLIVGRKTWESCAHLPRLIVLTKSLLRDKMPLEYSVLHAEHPGTRFVSSVDEALQFCTPDACVIGGAQIYKAFLPLAGRLYLTQVNVTAAGDTFFPDFGRRNWQSIVNDQRGNCRFLTYVKMKNAPL